MEKTMIIPTPKKCELTGKTITVPATVSSADFAAEASVFAEHANRLGMSFTLCDCGAVKASLDKELKVGEYRISTHGSGVEIFASDKTGASYAFATLLQMMKSCGAETAVPEVEITDSPDLDYRGLLIDCARSFHTLDEIKRYIDVCWFYKVKYLHVHFTDDEHYTLPSKKFPKLTTPEKSFTFEEIAEMDAYADSRAVQIVPEVDTPGHSTVIQNSYPELFGNTGIICFHEDAIAGVGEILKEVCGMFPHSEYVHIGGDESRLGWWLACDDCLAYGKELGITPEEDGPDGMPGREYLMLRYLAHFIAKNAEAVKSCGKKAIVWEGFNKATNDMIPKDVSVMVFDSSYQTADSLYQAGFNVINCSWFPTYVVTPCWYYGKDDCFKWDVYSFGTINDLSPYRNGVMRYFPDDHFVGGQLSSWGDVIEKDFPSVEAGHKDELEKILDRLPAIAENTWNKEKITCLKSFAECRDALTGIVGELIK